MYVPASLYKPTEGTAEAPRQVCFQESWLCKVQGLEVLELACLGLLLSWFPREISLVSTGWLESPMIERKAPVGRGDRWSPLSIRHQEIDSSKATAI